jgi:hypothetical protein
LLFVIEGLDQTGKTTLAQTLATILPQAKIVHAAKPKAHPLVDYEQEVSEYHPANGHLILDRFHVGEMVWPKIFERKSEFDWAMYRHVEMFLRSRGGIVIHAFRALSKLADELEDEPVTIQQATIAADLFSEAHEMGSMLRLNYDYEAASRIGLYVTHAHQAQSAARKVFKVSSEWIGNPRPQVLLVGERPNAQDGMAFVPFMPFRNASGHFLMEELAYTDWRNTAICNAYRSDGTEEQLEPLWHAMGDPKVIALGRVAEAVCEEMRIPFVHAVHPQFARRFERKRGRGAYGRNLC